MKKTLMIGLLGLLALGCGGGGADLGGGGGGGGGSNPYAGKWAGSMTGGMKGTLNVLISPKGPLSLNGTVIGGPSFSGSGKVSEAGVVTGELADGAGAFSGQVRLGGVGLEGTVTLSGKTADIALRKGQ